MGENMRPPTYHELLEYVDGTLEPSRYNELKQDIERSPQLQKEIELIGAMNAVVRHQPVNTSAHFTAALLREVLPPKHESLWFRIIKNSSNVFAMMMVLAMTGFTVMASSGNGTPRTTPLSQGLDSFSVLYRSLVQQFSQILDRSMPPSLGTSESISLEVLFIGGLIFFFYAAVDDLLGRRFHVKK